MDTPVGDSEFAALMAPFGPWSPDVEQAPVGLAVSGGGDSMALAFLARRWRRHVLAFVVDHALRPESAAEARLTVQRLQDMGLNARLLTLQPFPAGRLQERARQARFDALENACAAEGCIDLLVAHHRHDQDETVWMRRQRQSGASGLSGIQPASLRGRIRVVRPLLGLSPDRLRATLRTAGLDWIEDPSNRNRRFERVRWRQDLTSGQRAEAARLHFDAVEQRACFEMRLADDLAQHAVWHPSGWALLRRAGIRDDTMSALIRLVGGGMYRPSGAAVATLVRRGQGTLGGVVVRSAGRFGEGVMLLREERAVQKPVMACENAVWDGRWRLQGVDAPAGSMIGALGDAVHVLDPRRLGLPSAAARCLPGLWCEGRLIRWPTVLGMPDGIGFTWAGGVPVTGENGAGA